MSDDPPTGPNGGPPHLDNPALHPIPLDQLRHKIDQRIGDSGRTVRDDLGAQGPVDPLELGKDPLVVERDLPIVTIQNSWTVQQVRNALTAHMVGQFFSSGSLVDAVIADDRVTSVTNTRLSGLFSQEVIFDPANDSSAAREVRDAWVEAWPTFCSGGSLRQIGAYTIQFGFWPSQLVYRESAKGILQPIPVPWHARYTYFDWDLRRFIAITKDGNKAIIAGDGKWMVHAPRGEYRAWVWGALRAVAEPWLFRHFAMRDMANFSEVFVPLTRAYTPAAADKKFRDQWVSQLANRAQNTTVLIPRGVDKDLGYDVDLCEVTGTGWEIFPGLCDRADMHITLAILMQNLTTEVKGGSFAATESHMDILQFGIQDDNESWKLTIHDQAARAFAHLNFGDADLAPWTYWNVKSVADRESKARRFYSFGQSLQILRQGGIKFTDEAKLHQFAKEAFDIDLPKFEITEPNVGDAELASGGKKEDK
jgi:hypothetical protein